MLKYNPTKHLIAAWMTWFKANDFHHIQINVITAMCQCDGFKGADELDSMVNFAIGDPVAENLELNDDHLLFDAWDGKALSKVNVPYDAILGMQGWSDNREESVDLPVSVFAPRLVEEIRGVAEAAQALPRLKPSQSKRPTLTIVK